MRYCLYFLFLFATAIPAYHLHAQTTVSITARETFSTSPIPFAHFTVNDSIHLIADIYGMAHIDTSQVNVSKITLNHPLHRNYTYHGKLDSAKTFFINKHLLFLPDDNSDAGAIDCIKHVLTAKTKYQPGQLSGYEHDTYKKIAFSLNMTTADSFYIKPILQALKIDSKTLTEEQELFLLEAISHKEVLDEYNQKEVIEAYKAGGLDLPTILNITPYFSPLDIYAPSIKMGTKDFVTPFAGNPFKRYHFNMADTIPLADDTIMVIKVNPMSHKGFKGVNGYLYISSKHNAVKYYNIEPNDDKRLRIKQACTFTETATGYLFPDISVTTYDLPNIVNKRFTIQVKITSRNTAINTFSNNEGHEFDEVIFEIPDTTTENTTKIVNDRPDPLSLSEKKTYDYYKKYGINKRMTTLLNLGDFLIDGTIHYKFLDFDVNKIINFNEHEGLRLGMGMYTDPSLIDRVRLGGYVGYGFKDKGFKYGSSIDIQLKKQHDVTISAAYDNDVFEAGGVDFVFDRYQYQSERLRKYRIVNMDRWSQLHLSLKANPIKFLYTKAGVKVGRSTPEYAYRYNPLPFDNFDFAMIYAGFRFAYGELYIRSEKSKYRLKTKFPVVWAQLTKGVEGVFDADIDFTKVDVKLEQNIDIVGLGTTSFQVIAGKAWGTTPYFTLYNGNGSLRVPSIIIHNSFETMRFNEFLSDQYAAIYFSHIFLPINIGIKNFRPELEIAHNMGVGSLKNPQNHALVNFNTLDNGYFESGIFANNLFVVKAPGVKIGLGTGFYVRYGAYTLPKTIENVFLKIAFNLML